MHYGLDLKLEKGDPVVCAFPGMVRISKYNKTFGNVVVVRHHNGLETLYAHLSKRGVEPGQVIAAAYEVHKELGWGFLEKVYENAMVLELTRRGLRATPQAPT